MKILKFSAIWCPACLVMNKVASRVSKDYKMEIINYDYDIDEEEVKKWNIGNKLPVFIFIDDNQNEIKRLIGEHNYDEFVDIIEMK